MKSSIDIAAECIEGSIVRDLEISRDKWSEAGKSLARAMMRARVQLIGSHNKTIARKKRDAEIARMMISMLFGAAGMLRSSAVAASPVIKAMDKGAGLYVGQLKADLDGDGWSVLQAGNPIKNGEHSAETRALQEVADAEEFAAKIGKKISECFEPIISQLTYQSESLSKRSPFGKWAAIDEQHKDETYRISFVEEMVLSWYLEKRAKCFMWSHFPVSVGDAERETMVARMLWTKYIHDTKPTEHWRTHKNSSLMTAANATAGTWQPMTKHPGYYYNDHLGRRERGMLREEKANMTHISREAVKSMSSVGIPVDLLGVTGAVDTPGESARMDKWAASNVKIMEKGILPAKKRNTEIMYSHIHAGPA